MIQFYGEGRFDAISTARRASKGVDKANKHKKLMAQPVSIYL
jgi:hypothetical protein